MNKEKGKTSMMSNIEFDGSHVMFIPRTAMGPILKGAGTALWKLSQYSYLLGNITIIGKRPMTETDPSVDITVDIVEKPDRYTMHVLHQGTVTVKCTGKGISERVHAAVIATFQKGLAAQRHYMEDQIKMYLHHEAQLALPPYQRQKVGSTK